MAETEKKDDPKAALVEEAQKRFQHAIEADISRNERLDDIKFARLGDQWPEWAKLDRSLPGKERPMLVINRLTQFRDSVVNTIRQAKPGIMVRPVDDHADVDTAEVLQGLIRHIQDASNASISYDTAAEYQVDSGLGYFVVRTDFEAPDSFNQEIKIERVADPFRVYFDPDSTQPDGSDARWAMIVEDVAKDEFEKLYPDAPAKDWEIGGPGDASGWIGKETIRVAEYFYLTETPTELLLLADGRTVYADQAPKDIGVLHKRKTNRIECKWCKIAGHDVIDETVLPCTMIPVIPVVGHEVWADGRRHLSGLIRFAKDSQRQYNFTQSAITEAVSLAPKAPFMVAEGQLDGYEHEWALANRQSLPYLTYKPLSVAGNLLGAPQRQQPAAVQQGLERLMLQSVDDMKASMGIYDPSLGANAPEQSGKAIQLRQRQADVGTFHYQDNLNRSIRHAGKIILEMIPKVYDTRRVARIIGADGEVKAVTIDPNGQTDAINNIYNPTVGRYDVTIDTGPSYATKRQEMADNMINLTQANPQIWNVAGDLLMKNLDWPGAEEIAKRMQAMLPPPILQQIQQDEGGQPQQDHEQAAQQQQMQQAMQEMQQQLQSMQQQLADKMADLEVKQFEAETRRLEVMARIEQEHRDFELKLVQEHAKYSDLEAAEDVPMGGLGE